MLEGSNVKIRLLEPDDLDFLEKIENNEVYWKLSDTIVPFSRKVLEEYILSEQDIFLNKQLRFVVVETVNNKAVGFLDLFDFNPIHLRAGVGIIIDEKHQNNGYAGEALKLLDQYVSEHLKMKNLHAQVMEKNEFSHKLFIASGYKKSGVWSNWVNHRGDWIDVTLYQKTL